ncbi:hypothetical protein Tco_1210694 [Tanacetum coccineum]
MSTAYHPQTDGQSVVCFGKKGKLAPRFVGPFEIIEKVGLVAYRLRLPEELNSVHDTFHVSNLKKCLADPTLQVPLDEIQVDAKLNFVVELVAILEREFKKLKRSRIAIVKVRWNSKRRPEFTWKRTIMLCEVSEWNFFPIFAPAGRLSVLEKKRIVKIEMSVLLYGEHKAQAQAELFVVTRALRCVLLFFITNFELARSWQFALCMLEGVDVRSRAIKVSVVVTPALGSMCSLVFFTWAQTVNWFAVNCILSKPIAPQCYYSAAVRFLGVLHEDAENSSKQERNLQEEGLDGMVRSIIKDKSEDFETPKQGKTLGEADISPEGLEAAETPAKVLTQRTKTYTRKVKTGLRRKLDADEVSTGEGINTGFTDVNTAFEEIKSGDDEVNSGDESIIPSPKKTQREGKAVLEEKSQSKRTKKQIREEQASLAEIDALIAKRVQYELELTASSIEAHNEDTQRNLKFISEDQVRGGLLGIIVNRLKSGSYRVKSVDLDLFKLAIVLQKAKQIQFHIDLVHGATSVAKSPYRLAPLEMQELSEQLRELQDKVLELLRKEKLYAKFTKSEAVKNWEIVKPITSLTERDQKYEWGAERKEAFQTLKNDLCDQFDKSNVSSVKDKILATSSETSKVENAPAEMLRDLDQQMEKRVDDG